MYTDPEKNARARAASIVHRLVGDITAKIEQREWLPGHKLPTERTLEAEFGVTRNTLRKGLKALEAKGLITRRIGSGSFVADPDRRAPAKKDAISAAAEASPSEVIEVRLLIEPWAAALAALRASSADLGRLRDCLEAGGAAEDYESFEHWDGQLHAALIGATKNEMLLGMQALIDAARFHPDWRVLKARTSTPENRRVYETQHRAVVEAVLDRDPDRARAAMETHLLHVRHVLLGT